MQSLWIYGWRLQRYLVRQLTPYTLKRLNQLVNLFGLCISLTPLFDILFVKIFSDILSAVSYINDQLPTTINSGSTSSKCENESQGTSFPLSPYGFIMVKSIITRWLRDSTKFCLKISTLNFPTTWEIKIVVAEKLTTIIPQLAYEFISGTTMLEFAIYLLDYKFWN